MIYIKIGTRKKLSKWWKYLFSDYGYIFKEQSNLDIPGSSGESKMSRYIEVHGISRFIYQLSYNIHGWGIITVPGISRFTVYRGTVYRGLTVQ